MRRIDSLCPGESGLIEATIKSVSIRPFGYRKSILVAKLEEDIVADSAGSIEAIWFNQPYLKGRLEPGTRLRLFGRVGETRDKLRLENPEFELVDQTHEKEDWGEGIVPVYSLSTRDTPSFSQRQFRRLIRAALEIAFDLEEDEDSPPLRDPIPASTQESLDLMPLRIAIKEVHFPTSIENAESARHRFRFEELFLLQAKIGRHRIARRRSKSGIRHNTQGEKLRAFSSKLPFKLTQSQEKVVEEILDDMAGHSPMRRLLHGEVGSGKTVVALHGVVAALDGGYQVAVMAPTEILAEQHYLRFEKWLTPIGIPLCLLTSSIREAARKDYLRRLSEGEPVVMVGTHALIEERVQFPTLGLVVIDEQHRFGVRQRQKLAKKGSVPDVLQMSATPIPRTAALTLYGDVDLSALTELPPGRQPVETRVCSSEDLEGVYRFLESQVDAEGQVFFISPTIEHSDKFKCNGVLEAHRNLTRMFPGLSVGLLHGGVGLEERHSTIDGFNRGEIQILASTTVVEVGIDVPGANCMVIENAERFGLAQLHQLRGRIGRGKRKSFCFLVPGPAFPQEGMDVPPTEVERLSILESTSDGFEIARKDLEIRGPGELFGRRQSGRLAMKLADLIGDADLLEEARKTVDAIFDADPQLDAPDHQALKTFISS